MRRRDDSLSLGQRIAVWFCLFIVSVGAILVLALGTTGLTQWFAVKALAPDSTLPWLQALRAFDWKLGITFSLAGLTALLIMRSARRVVIKAQFGPSLESDRKSGRQLLLVVGLVNLPLATLAVAQPLVSLWREAFELIGKLGVWDEARKILEGDPQFSGLILAPMAVLSLVPLLEFGPAISFLVGSTLLLVLLYTKSSHFPKAFLACAALQLALVLGTFYIIDLTGSLTLLLHDELSSLGGREAMAFSPWIQHHDEVIGPTALYFVCLFIGYLACVSAVLLSKGGRAAVATLGRAADFSVASRSSEPPPLGATSSETASAGAISGPMQRSSQAEGGGSEIGEEEVLQFKVVISERLDAEQRADFEEATSHLRGLVARFKPEDPVEVQRAIESMEEAVDAKLSRYSQHPWVVHLGQGLKDNLRKSILQKAAEAQRKKPT